jgi:hypothetical protein
MPPRRQTPKVAQKHEMEAFAEQYETLAAIYGNPVEALFEIMADTGDEELRARVAVDLMSFRFPKVKASEGNGNKSPTMNFNVILPEQKVVELPVNRPPTLVLKEHK